MAQVNVRPVVRFSGEQKLKLISLDKVEPSAEELTKSNRIEKLKLTFASAMYNKRTGRQMDSDQVAEILGIFLSSKVEATTALKWKHFLKVERYFDVVAAIDSWTIGTGDNQRHGIWLEILEIVPSDGEAPTVA